ncbi:MAG: hypothetical protein AVDCRST_MAG49-3289, partial [uncultured Thermomicrobiales bacterium]
CVAAHAAISATGPARRRASEWDRPRGGSRSARARRARGRRSPPPRRSRRRCAA